MWLRRRGYGILVLSAAPTPQRHFAKVMQTPHLNVRDTLPFNRLMRNFKLNSVFYERERRAFDRIELNSRSAKRGDSRVGRAEKTKEAIAKPCQRGRAGTRVPTMSGETGRVTRPA